MRRPVSLSLTLLATAALGLSACKRVDAPAAEAATPEAPAAAAKAEARAGVQGDHRADLPCRRRPPGRGAEGSPLGRTGAGGARQRGQGPEAGRGTGRG
ncbi:hypothetical protein G6F50_017588 [Rhizopus delemar]|uniref:Lipoprotein n=1 Tax=Rhizopus delemar TaxID=936053 RepID=A0A9P6XQL9_9FUNG|nr:hypothetical protein G6F50_017588 [Rhizopus delemar]